MRAEADHLDAEVDPSHLRRILVNLVSNALRQVQPLGGEVELVVGAATGGGASVEVSDSGPGIAPELRARLFERFASFSRQGSTASGIGLALARELAQLNGATLELVEGAPRTTFRLQLAPTSSTAAGRAVRRDALAFEYGRAADPADRGGLSPSPRRPSEATNAIPTRRPCCSSRTTGICAR